MDPNPLLRLIPSVRFHGIVSQVLLNVQKGLALSGFSDLGLGFRVLGWLCHTVSRSLRPRCIYELDRDVSLAAQEQRA